MKKAYKLIRIRKNGTLGPLFINRRQVIPVGDWLTAEAHRTKGFAYRPGWHCCNKPEAPHLSSKGRVWCEVCIDDFETIQRPENQGGLWFLAKKMKVIKILN